MRMPSLQHRTLLLPLPLLVLLGDGAGHRAIPGRSARIGMAGFGGALTPGIEP